MPEYALEPTLRDIRDCRLCADDFAHAPRPIVQASPKARILIAGQAPGRRVHETGIPFNDPSGERLRRWLGVDRDTFYDPARFAIVPMGFCYPGTGEHGDLPPRPECAKAWRGRLMTAMPQLQIILAIGRYARDWHLPEERGKPMADTCARWREFWPFIVPMPHPSPRNRKWFAEHEWFEAEVVPSLQTLLRTWL